MCLTVFLLGCIAPVVSSRERGQEESSQFPQQFARISETKMKFCHLHGKESREREEVLLGIGNVKT